MKKILLSTVIILCSLPSFAVVQKEIKADNLSVQKSGQNVNISFSIDIETAKSKNYKLILTPVLFNGDKQMRLKQIVVDTRRTRIVDARNGVAPVAEAYNAEYGSKLNYTFSVPYQRWMEGSSLRLDRLWTGCCNEDSSTSQLGGGFKFIIPVQVYNITPSFSYIKPDVEVPKYRHESGTAFVEFQQGRSVLVDTYRNNLSELAKIRNSFELVKKEEGTTITNIELQGSCSPEASWAFNTRLAEERTSVVNMYINSRYGISMNLIKANSIPEDWATFKTLVERSNITERDEILAIINSDKLPDVKDTELAKMPVYKYLMSEIYPQLRKVEYKVNYIVEGFDLEASKRVLESNPKNLNLIEMFVIANSYPKGSAEFNRAFEVAAKYFATDAVAATNAAITAYNNGDTAKAESYLANITSSDLPEYNNMVGVVAMMKGEYPRAEQYLKKAADKGSAQAKTNLAELNKKMENIKAVSDIEKELSQYK